MRAIILFMIVAWCTGLKAETELSLTGGYNSNIENETSGNETAAPYSELELTSDRDVKLYPSGTFTYGVEGSLLGYLSSGITGGARLGGGVGFEQALIDQRWEVSLDYRLIKSEGLSLDNKSTKKGEISSVFDGGTVDPSLDHTVRANTRFDLEVFEVSLTPRLQKVFLSEDSREDTLRSATLELSFALGQSLLLIPGLSLAELNSTNADGSYTTTGLGGTAMVFLNDSVTWTTRIWHEPREYSLGNRTDKFLQLLNELEFEMSETVSFGIEVDLTTNQSTDGSSDYSTLNTAGSLRFF